jgi:carboxyl-terminal processing protease
MSNVKQSRAKALFLAVILALFATGNLVRPLSAANETTTETKLSRDYVAAMETIREHYVEQVDYEQLNRNGIQGMLHVLDPHSNFFDRKGFAEMNSEQRSHYYGIGAQIAPRNGGTFIIEPFQGTPAARAGLRYGDHIVNIDGQDTSTWSSDKVRNLLRGDRGTQVKVTVRRVGVDQPVAVTIQRDSVALPSITNYYNVRPGIGYIGLTRGFHSTTTEELTAAMADLREHGAASFVLDLRNNPGGYLDQAIKVADKLLQKGQVIVSVKGRVGRNFDNSVTAETGATEDFPLVVLIDGGTASASEIVAGAVQDHDRGLIIGENSFGKGLVQHIYPLPGATGLTLTIARYYTPSGRLIQRDYSNGSFYEYLTHRVAPGVNVTSGTDAEAKSRKDEHHTDLGRNVFGGGGIEPDISVKTEDILTRDQFRLYSGLFMFVRELMAGKVASAADFKRAGLEYDHKLKPNEFLITDATLKAYRDFMGVYIKDHADAGLTQAMVDDNVVWARKQIRHEALVAAYGSDRAQEAEADLDLQLQRALTELPNAAQLSSRAWQRPRSGRN